MDENPSKENIETPEILPNDVLSETCPVTYNRAAPAAAHPTHMISLTEDLEWS